MKHCFITLTEIFFLKKGLFSFISVNWKSHSSLIGNFIIFVDVASKTTKISAKIYNIKEFFNSN